jgi:filamentous hemagglutinin
VWAGTVAALAPTASQSAVTGSTANAATGVSTATRTSAASAQTGLRTLQASSQLPNTSLYRQHPESNARYLVETDPKFANYKTWLGSDYMLNALNLDPAATQKRLGDGFYEQKLIREQVMALTGNRFLGDYQSDEQQYMALMNSGLTYAKQFNLRPGIALTPEQVAQLTSDMVWLVSQDVTLADGSVQSVLVPQVYVRVKEGDLDGTGALLSGKDVKLNLTGDLTNSGTIAGRNLLQINADNIQNLGGQMSADTLALAAKEDINNIGGLMQGVSAAVATAGRDVNLTTTTQSSLNKVGANSFAQTGIDRVAGLYVSGSAGTLVASAGRDLNLTAAAVGNAGTGPTVLAAGNNLNLNTVTNSNSQDINWSGVNYLRQSQSQDVGSQINAAGNLTVSAGKDLNAKAASVNAGQALSISAGNNINITTGQASQSLDTANTVTSKGTFSSRTLSTRETSQSTTALASNFEGNSVNINAGQDLNVKGSNVLADQSVNLTAGGNVNITAAQNTQTQSSFRQETKSGLMSGAGIGFTVGKREQSLDQGQTQTSAAGSTIGSTGGNVSISAGKTYTQTGSDVLTPGLNSPSGSGDIAITAKAVTINEARETGSQSTEQKFKQSGLTVAITSPVLSAVQTASNQLQAAGNTSAGRMQALAAANAAMNANNAVNAVKTGQAKQGGNAADQAGGVGISISVGSSSSQAKQQSSADSAKGSNVSAGGNVSITATGAGQDSYITVRGSDINAGGKVSLKAEDQVNIAAVQNTTTESSSAKNSSGSIGVGINLGSDGFKAGITVSAAAGKGQGAGNGTPFTNSHVNAQQITLDSGGDTTIKGGVVKAEQVTANVGGNLNIESLQDKNDYNESSKSAGGSVTIGPSSGGNLNLAASKVSSNYLSVNEQSAIRSGDGGFNVNVQGKTDLTGGQITSTDKAVQDGKNTFTSAGGVTTTDLQNSASYSANSVSVGLGAGSPAPGQSMSAAMSGMGLGSDKGSANSTTTAGISGITGNTSARTGDKETGIKPIFDADKVKKEIEAQVTITQEFNKQAGQAISSYADTQRKAAQEQLKNATTDESRAKAEQAIKDANMQERALNILVSGLTGMAGATITKEALSTAAEKMRDLMIEDSEKFAGVVDSTGKVLSNVSGPSDGVRGDGYKIGGTRVDLDLLCGPDNGRCTFEKLSDGTIDKSKPVTFKGPDVTKPDGTVGPQTIDEFLATPEGKKIAGATGGVQGVAGTLFGVPYAAGSWQDKLIEAFAGTHDFVGGKLSGLYDAQGNATRGRDSTTKNLQDAWSASGAILVSAPFAAAEGMSPEVWKAIGILLGAAK